MRNDGGGKPALRGLGALTALGRRVIGRARTSLRTTPGRLLFLACGLVSLIIVAGIGAAVGIDQRSQVTDDLTHRHETTAATVGEVYRALSDADATAATAFLAAGNEPEELRTRFEDDIARAGPSLGLIGVDPVTQPDAARQVGVVGRGLPVYTGLIETARTNNRQGLPVGAAYLRQASHEMRSEILPAVQRLYRMQRAQVTDAQDSATGIPSIAGALVLGALVAVLLTHRYIRRLAKRRYNIGLIVAAGAIVVGLAWSALAVFLHGTLVTEGRHEGSDQVNRLVESRIIALQARADELLTLVARSTGGEYEQAYASAAAKLTGEDGALGELAAGADGAMGGHLDDAAESARAWLSTHEQVRQLADDGKHGDAVQLAIDPDADDGATAAFTRLDGDLAKAIAEGRQEFVDSTVTGNRMLTLLAPGWLVLAAIAACGVVTGISARLQEYRWSA